MNMGEKNNIVPSGNRQPTIVQQQITAYSGPIPDPQAFARYEQILPGSADRILKMAEQQADHRHQLEKRVVIGNQRRDLAGLVLGFVIAFMGIGGSIYLLANDKNLQGFLLGGGVLGSLVGTFVYGKKTKEKDLDEKRQMAERP